MENDEPNDLGDADFSVDSSCTAVNKIILDYYRKFGRKRDIEQFFSLSTAQQDLSETSSLFWKRMKEQNDSSDSGDKKTGSSTELCRISIKCSVDNHDTSKPYDKNTDSDTESPPIISDDVPDKCLDSGDESNKSDGEQSHKSIDMTLDTSLNRPHSPTSSITSQRKLEWDSLADVGYGNESDRKNSASSLSTLERLALHQQYSNNDTKQTSELGVPTAHSTPLDQTESRSKLKKDGNKKTSKFCKKDVDIMEVNIPSTSDNTNQPINVNLTKHISFNVERDGGVKMDNMSKHISVSQDNLGTETPKDNVDKEIQTTLPRTTKDNVALPTKDHSSRPRFPILINLNTIKNRKKKRKRRLSRPRKKGTVDKENIPQEKSINQESDAESFEYMPGHMYNPNKLESNGSVLNVADNKSSLESSAGHTTESSKDFQCTFTKELEKSIDLLKLALQHRYKDTSLKKKLIKEVVQSLVQTNYKNDGTSNDLMFGFNQNNQTPSSTSESNNLDSKKPKKSILHVEKFNSGKIATTSQSAPNLPTISTEINPDKPPKPVNISSTDSDFSYKSKYLSEVFLANSSSEQIYKKYLLALKKENIYKKKLKEQELLLRQKITQPSERECQADIKEKNTLDHLIKDLTKNNFADGSGDASNACHSSSNVENGPAQRSKSQCHTVFTLSGSNDFKKNKKLRNRLENEINYPNQASSSTQCQGCCAYRRDKIVVTDSSVQVNFDSQCMPKTENILLEQNTPLENEKVSNKNSQENIKYVCLCSEKLSDVPDNFLIYRCSRMPSKCIMVGSNIKTDICLDAKSDNTELAYNAYACENKDLLAKKNSTTSTQSSQTHFSIPQFVGNSYSKLMSSSSENRRSNKNNTDKNITSLKKASSNTCRSTILTQTEISIDPKISDPSISDIKIIENEVCYDKDSEQEKNFSDVGSNENKEENNKKIKDALRTQTKHVVEGTDVDAKRRSQDKKLEENDSQLISLQNLQPHSNFTIPILGTNMTLKVSLDSRDSLEKKTNDIKPTYSQQSLQSNDFERFKRVENNYCTLQSENIRQKQTECVSVQTSNTGENKDIDENKKICYSETSYGQIPTTSAFRYESINMGHCNTYPKENIPKTPLLRSNTDTGKMKSFDPSLLTVKKNNPPGEKSSKEPLLKSQGGTDKFLKKSLPRPKTESNKNEIDVRQNISKDIKDKNPEKSEKPLLTTEPNKKEFHDPHTSIATKEAEPPSNEGTPGTLDKPLLRSNIGSDREELFGYNASTGKENEYSKEETFKKPLVTSNTDSNKKELLNRSTSMGKGSDSSKEGTLKKPMTVSKPNSNNKELSDRYTSMERKYSNELLRQSNINADKISTAPIHRKHVDTQYDYYLSTQTQTKEAATEITDNSKSSNETRRSDRPKSSKNSENTNLSSSNTDESKSSTRDPLLDIIRDITKRYTKKEVDKGKRKKCYAEIIAVLNYLLDTSETTENESTKVRNSSASEGPISTNRSRRSKINEKPRKALKKDITDFNACTNDFNVDEKAKKTYKDQSVQLSPRKSKQDKCCGESTDCPMSTDIHSTSTDYTARKTQHKLKHQCERHQCCKSHCRKCDVSSSSSVTCDPCKHRCHCRGHKTHRPRNSDKTKKCVAYNLILQTSDSIASEEMDKHRVERHLKNIIVKVPSKRRVENMQFKEVTQKIERHLPRQFTKDTRNIPQDNEVSSTDNILKDTATCTIRDYLKQNKPDFIERSTQRQSCLKLINEARATERAAKREVLSAHVADVANQDGELRRLAELLGKDLRTRKLAPKFISEKEMKKHSEKIYKSLPEVQRKKEEIKKERVKKTNLLMANIFKKNLQKKTLRGAVNLSNYSAVIKI